MAQWDLLSLPPATLPMPLLEEGSLHPTAVLTVQGPVVGQPALDLQP